MFLNYHTIVNQNKHKCYMSRCPSRHTYTSDKYMFYSISTVKKKTSINKQHTNDPYNSF